MGTAVENSVSIHEVIFRGCMSTMHGWRQAPDCEGITWAHKDFWVSSTPNFMTGLKNMRNCCQVGVTTFKHSARVYVLQVVSVLNNFIKKTSTYWIRQSYMWATAYRLELKGQSSTQSQPHHHKKHRGWQNPSPTQLAYSIQGAFVCYPLLQS